MGVRTTQLFEEVQKAREQLSQLTWRQWKSEMVFTWRWWLLVALTVVPLVVWWKIVDRNRAYEIAFYGCFLNISAVFLDNIGTGLLWWSYPIKLIPVVSHFFTPDSILVPIVLMIVYQFFSSTWKQFFVANVVTAAFLAFVAEPVFIWLGYYQLNDWKLVCSFLFYLAASSLARIVILRITGTSLR